MVRIFSRGGVCVNANVPVRASRDFLHLAPKYKVHRKYCKQDLRSGINTWQWSQVSARCPTPHLNPVDYLLLLWARLSRERQTAEKVQNILCRTCLKTANVSWYMILYLKFIWHILLVERIEPDKLETLCHNVEGLVVSFGAHRRLIGADLQKQRGGV